MDKNEQKIYEHITKEATEKMDFNKIVNKVDYLKYKKEKKTFHFPKRLTLSFTTFVLIFTIIFIAILIPSLDNRNSKDKDEIDENETTIDATTPGDPENDLEFQVVEYSGFIKELFENSIGDGPSYSFSGPMPLPPVIDGYFNDEMDNSIEGDITSGDVLDNIIVLETRTFDYIYEVEFKNTSSNEYVAVYIERQLAQKIYEENKTVMDAPNASSLDVVNGSIVDWFYSNRYYDNSKALWCKYDSSEQIYSEINDYVCVGVYNPQQRIIVREIFSNTQVNIIDDIYTKLYFKNEGKMYLIPVVNKSDDKISWFTSNYIINKNNTNTLFVDDFNNEIDCVIDKEVNTIKLKTYAVQSETELNKNYFSSLKDYHISSNQVIIENSDPNKELGEMTYIIYKYNELVQILQDLAN